MYKLTYNVFGEDHDGYCSGAEGEDCETYNKDPAYKLPDYVTFSDKIPTSEYFMEEGCTSSGGSGYCKNFKREYYLNSLVSISEDEKKALEAEMGQDEKLVKIYKKKKQYDWNIRQDALRKMYQPTDVYNTSQWISHMKENNNCDHIYVNMRCCECDCNILDREPKK
jgi:hypothetical protein